MKLALISIASIMPTIIPISMLILAASLNSCASVWPNQCDISMRGKTVCKCNSEVVVKKNSVEIMCSGSKLPIEIHGETSVSIKKKTNESDTTTDR